MSVSTENNVDVGNARNGWDSVNIVQDDGPAKELTHQTFVDRHNADQRVRKIGIFVLLVLVAGCALAAYICITKAHALQARIDDLDKQIPWNKPRDSWTPDEQNANDQYQRLGGDQFGFGLAAAVSIIAGGVLLIPIGCLLAKMYKTKHCKLSENTTPVATLIDPWSYGTTIPLHSLIAHNTQPEFLARCGDISTLKITEDERTFLNSQR